MKVSRGTPQQLLNAVERKIQELGGDLEVNSSTVISSMYEDCDGSLAGPGASISQEELEDIWYRDHKDDPSMAAYDTFESWLSDTIDNGYIKPIDSACNSSNVSVSTAVEDTEDAEVTYDVVEASDDDIEDVDQLEDGEYIQGLKATCDSKLEGSVDSTTWSEDDDNLYLTVAASDEVHDFTIPRADLTNDEDTDTEYICSYVSDTLE